MLTECLKNKKLMAIAYNSNARPFQSTVLQALSECIA